MEQEQRLIKVKERLASLGYTVKGGDEWAINFCIKKVEAAIKSETNADLIAEGLEPILIDRTCGEFLLEAKGAGQIEGYDFEAAVKSIDEGDVKVSFAVGDGSSTPEQRFDRMVAKLMGCGRDEILAHRRMVW